MGRSLVRAALSHGDQCTAVGWTQENTVEQMNKWQERNCLGLLCDVRVRDTVDQVIRKSIDHWGHVDIIAKYVHFLLASRHYLTAAFVVAPATVRPLRTLAIVIDSSYYRRHRGLRRPRRPRPPQPIHHKLSRHPAHYPAFATPFPRPIVRSLPYLLLHCRRPRSARFRPILRDQVCGGRPDREHAVRDRCLQHQGHTGGARSCEARRTR